VTAKQHGLKKYIVRPTSIHTVVRTRQQLVEEGFDAALTRKHSPASARRRIFDGAAEAKLIALALVSDRSLSAQDAMSSISTLAFCHLFILMRSASTASIATLIRFGIVFRSKLCP
jgi:hypothetical protein